MDLKSKLLIDKSRLQEIYDLRVLAWEDSNKSQFVNRTIFPNGWKNEFDDDAYHWIVEDKGKIIASARLNIFNSFEEFNKSYMDLFLEKKKDIAELSVGKQYGYFSRLVVASEYRHKGLSNELIQARLQFIYSNNVSFVLACVHSDMLPVLLNAGFELLGEVPDTYGNNSLITIAFLLVFLNSRVI